MALFAIGGDISHRSRLKEVTWKIKKFFEMLELKSITIVSPEFSFSGSIWTLYFFQVKKPMDRDPLTMFGLHKVGASNLNLELYFEMGFRLPDGTMDTRRKKKFSLEGDFSINRFSVEQDELTAMREVIAPEDTLTVFCKMSLDSDGTDQKQSPSISVVRLQQDFEQLLLSEDESDATFSVKGQEFRAHRCILDARTPVFSSMFKCEMSEKNIALVTIEDCEPEIFKEVLHYLYVGSVSNMSLEIVFDLYSVAHKYEMEELKMECIDFMKISLSIDTFYNIVKFALRCHELELLTSVSDFFVGKTEEVIKTPDWRRFMLEDPSEASKLFMKAVDSDGERQYKNFSLAYKQQSG